jgi:hypothetical protein
MPPKRQQFNSSQKKTPTKKVIPKSETPTTGWEWAPFTKKAHEFTHAARVLSSSLKEAYGDNVSISQFEKFVGAIPSMTDAQRGLLYVDPKIVVLLKDYRTARASRDSERDNFRGDVAIGNVDTGLEALQDLGLLTSVEEGFEEEKDEEEEDQNF